MIEKTVIQYLKKKFPSIPVDAEVIKGMPDRFITVEKTGSRQLKRGIYQSTIAIQSWETSRFKAAELSEKVCEAMRSLPDEADNVSKSTGSDYDFFDTTTKRPRYQAVFEITHY